MKMKKILAVLMSMIVMTGVCGVGTGCGLELRLR